MTHFSVLVCASNPSEVETLLAPYNENLETAPRRSYEEGEARDHYAYQSLKADWEKALQTPEGQDRKLEARARQFLRLSDPPTWTEVAGLVNSDLEDSEDDRLLVDTEFPGGSRAYTMTTYNPDSKWDWWTTGGRWAGSFTYRPQFAEKVIDPDKGPAASWETAGLEALQCSGGPKYALDLEATRDRAEHEAREADVKWREVVRDTPEGQPWKAFVAETENVPGYTIEQARADYHNQPRILALVNTDFRFARDPIAEYDRTPLDERVRVAREQAILGYALVRRDGSWLAPGEMGWFAMSSDDDSSRSQYRQAASAYIDALPDDAWLVMVDCHI